MIDEHNLDNKLALWAGFKTKDPSVFQYRDNGEWITPDGQEVYLARNYGYFTTSIDRCFKWLTPKLTQNKIRVNTSSWKNHSVELLRVSNGTLIASHTDNNLALAFCLVIEKYLEKNK